MALCQVGLVGRPAGLRLPNRTAFDEIARADLFAHLECCTMIESLLFGDVADRFFVHAQAAPAAVTEKPK